MSDFLNLIVQKQGVQSAPPCTKPEAFNQALLRSFQPSNHDQA